MGIAQTGTGKTMAFAIPTIQRLAQGKGRALVIVPTRELALQVEESFFKIGRPFGIKTAVLIGGDPVRNQLKALALHPRVLIATPGRLIDLMEQRKVHLNDICVLILDEADRMFDMGFSDQIEMILRSVPKERQTMLFSATMPSTIIAVARSHMRLPVSVEIARSGATPEQVTHELFIIQNDMKRVLLGKLLAQFRGSVLLFCRTKMGARKISSALRQQGHRVAEIHSDRSLPQRREALEGFKRGKYRVLVATDIAARALTSRALRSLSITTSRMTSRIMCTVSGVPGAPDVRATRSLSPPRTKKRMWPASNALSWRFCRSPATRRCPRPSFRRSARAWFLEQQKFARRGGGDTAGDKC